MPEPNINLDLTKFPKKSTSASIFRALFHEITIKYQNPTTCFTDGSKINNKSGLAFFIGYSTYSYRHRSTATVFAVELEAIFLCLKEIASRPNNQPTTYLTATNSSQP